MTADLPDAAHGELYVYYRLPAAAAVQAQAEMAAVHETLLKTYPNLHSRWLQRCENRDEMRTWMEIHHQAGGLDAATMSHVCEILSPWPSARAGPRHVEVFASLPARGALPCA
jgi:endonuclease V-like protein UPF0215 family